MYTGVLSQFIMYIDAPDVVTTGTAGSYIIFGEVKFKEFGANAANKFVEKVKEAQAAKKSDKTETIHEEADEEETEDAGTLDESSIKTLMEYANCSRGKAIKCLKKTNGDVVEAITLAS